MVRTLRSDMVAESESLPLECGRYPSPNGGHEVLGAKTMISDNRSGVE